MEQEVWKDVVGYEGLYKVSSLGNIKRLNYRGKMRDRLLSTSLRRGYPAVNLSKNGVVRGKATHIMIAESFIDSNYKSKGLVVNHKNFKRDDSRLANLEVITQRENTNKRHLKSTSDYVGVCWIKKNRKWQAMISVNDLRKYLGLFDTEKEASDYYEAALVCIKENRIEDIKIKKPKFSSQHKGVSFHKPTNKWQTYLKINGKQKSIGLYKTEEEAVKSILEATIM